MSIFKYAQDGALKPRIIIRNNPDGTLKVEVVGGGPPEACDKIRRAIEARMGLSQADVITESKHDGVEEKMLAPIENEPEQERMREKY